MLSLLRRRPRSGAGGADDPGGSVTRDDPGRRGGRGHRGRVWLVGPVGSTTCAAARRDHGARVWRPRPRGATACSTDLGSGARFAEPCAAGGAGGGLRLPAAVKPEGGACLSAKPDTLGSVPFLLHVKGLGRWATAATGWLAGLCGCSLALDASEVQCTVAADCTARGFVGAACVDSACIVDPNPVDPRWACIGNIPEPVEQPGVTHIYRQAINDVVDELPPEGLTVKLCQTVDIACASPLIADVPVAADGTVEVEVPSGFEGYLDLVSDETMPALLFLGPPITADVLQTEPVQLVSQGLFDSIVTLAGYTPNPERGHALVLMADCNNVGAPGVSMSIDVDDPDTHRFYLYDLIPDPAATLSDDSGNGGYLNIPQGFATIEVTLAEANLLYSRARFQVRQGTISYVGLTPIFLE